jgi:DNA-binding FadR family transcriptional regulator
VQRRDPALRSSRAERVAADLEHEILSARLPVGAHLGRRSEIMDRFGISPTVMNETLRILRDRDLITVRPGPGGGITVASAPTQVRVGALDLSFQPSTPHPLDLFEAGGAGSTRWVPRQTWRVPNDRGDRCGVPPAD